jgi:nucleotide-binding universal stress UspA family protein
MLKILIPVDGSESSRRAAKHVVDLAQGLEPVDIHILNVQPPIMSGQVRMFVGQDVIDQYHKEESALALKPVRELLDQAGITYTAHSAVGHIAETIARIARDLHCDLIVMGTRGMSPIRNLVLGSVATQLIHLADIPVTLVK